MRNNREEPDTECKLTECDLTERPATKEEFKIYAETVFKSCNLTETNCTLMWRSGATIHGDPLSDTCMLLLLSVAFSCSTFSRSFKFLAIRFVLLILHIDIVISNSCV